MISVESVMTRSSILCVVASGGRVLKAPGRCALMMRCAASRRQGTFRLDHSNGKSAMPTSVARKCDLLFKVVVTIVALLISGLGAGLGMFAGYLIATPIFASPEASNVGETIGGTIGLASAVWFIAVAAKEL
jgi:hypothetical protein